MLNLILEQLEFWAHATQLNCVKKATHDLLTALIRCCHFNRFIFLIAVVGVGDGVSAVDRQHGYLGHNQQRIGYAARRAYIGLNAK